MAGLKVDAARLWKFAVVGGIGFAIEAVILLGLTISGWNAFAARLVSFPIAVFSTWLLNRAWAFRDRRRTYIQREALLYFVVQSSGLATNMIVFALVLSAMHSDALYVPILSLICASVAGLVVNFSGAYWLVFAADHANSASKRVPDA